MGHFLNETNYLVDFFSFIFNSSSGMDWNSCFSFCILLSKDNLLYLKLILMSFVNDKYRVRHVKK